MAKAIYISNLPEHQQQNIKYTPSNHVYCFGDGRKIMAIESITFPVKIGEEHINIQSDKLDNDISLLFTQSSMKKAEMKKQFQNDTINALRLSIDYHHQQSLCHSPTPAKQAINNIDRKNNSAITLTINNINKQLNQTINLKVTSKFVHPSSEKLICLLNNASTP